MTTITKATRPVMYQIIRPENGGPRGVIEAEFCNLGQALSYALAHCGSWHVLRHSETKVCIQNPGKHSLQSLAEALGAAR